MNVCHDIWTVIQVTLLNPKILPNEMYMCLLMTKILAQVVFQSISK